MRGGGIARKGVGMALKGGGLARKGTGSNKTPGGTIRKMAGGGETSAGSKRFAEDMKDRPTSSKAAYLERQKNPPTRQMTSKESYLSRQKKAPEVKTKLPLNPPVTPPAVNTKLPLVPDRPPMPKVKPFGPEYGRRPPPRPGDRPGPMPTEDRLRRMNPGMTGGSPARPPMPDYKPYGPEFGRRPPPMGRPGPMPTEDRLRRMNRGTMADAPRTPSPGTGKGSSGTTNQGGVGSPKPPLGRPGPMPTPGGMAQINPAMKNGGKATVRKKIAGVKMTAGAGSGPGRLQKVGLHKASTRVPAANLKKGGKIKASAEELREYRGGRYMGGPKEERAEKKRGK